MALQVACFVLMFQLGSSWAAFGLAYRIRR